MLCDDMKLDLRRIFIQNDRICETTDSSSFNTSQQCAAINETRQDIYPRKYSPMTILRYVHIKKVSVFSCYFDIPIFKSLRRFIQLYLCL